MYYQQGDVIIEQAQVPEAAKRIMAKGGQLILAEGEATGHAHAVVAGDGVSLLMLDNDMFLSVVGDPVTVKHQEHKPVDIPAGTYKVRRVREYDHFQEESRNVAD